MRDFLRIKEVIKSEGYTYETLGNEVGLTKTSIARIANGEQTPSFDMLKRIADILDADIRELFHSTKPMRTPKEELKIIRKQMQELESRL